MRSPPSGSIGSSLELTEYGLRVSGRPLDHYPPNKRGRLCKASHLPGLRNSFRERALYSRVTLATASLESRTEEFLERAATTPHFMDESRRNSAFHECFASSFFFLPSQLVPRFCRRFCPPIPYPRCSVLISYQLETKQMGASIVGTLLFRRTGWSGA